MTLRIAPTEQERIAKANEALAHLLVNLHKAARYFNEIGATGDAAVLEAHAGALARGREWPGDEITEPDWEAIAAEPAPWRFGCAYGPDDDESGAA